MGILTKQRRLATNWLSLFKEYFVKNAVNRQVKVGLVLLSLSVLSGCQATAYAVQTPNSSLQERAYSQPHYDEQSDGEYAFYQQILAPVALYPDSLLTHIFIASTYPIDIVEAARWNEKRLSKGKTKLSEKHYQQTLETHSWDPSVVTLLQFPALLAQMNADLSWTQALGDAFITNETVLLDAVQILRHKAKRAGQLAQLDNINVIHDRDFIIIQPASTQIIHVPHYDTRVIYGDWHWRHWPPVRWEPHAYYGGVFHNTALHGVNISFDFFFNAFHWRNRHVVVSSRANSRLYRPQKRILSAHSAKRWKHVKKHRQVRHVRRGKAVHAKALHPAIKATRKHDSKHHKAAYNTGYKNGDGAIAKRVKYKKAKHEKRVEKHNRKVVTRNEKSHVKAKKQAREQVNRKQAKRNNAIRKEVTRKKVTTREVIKRKHRSEKVKTEKSTVEVKKTSKQKTSRKAAPKKRSKQQSSRQNKSGSARKEHRKSHSRG